MEAGSHIVETGARPVRHGADQPSTHPQTLSTAPSWPPPSLGAIVNRLDLPPVNGEKAISRDSLAYLGTTPLTGNHAAIAALKASDLVLDLMTLLFSPEQHDILKSGTKILLAVEPPEVLARMVPTAGRQEARDGRAAKIGKARKCMLRRRRDRRAIRARTISGHQRIWLC